MSGFGTAALFALALVMAVGCVMIVFWENYRFQAAAVLLLSVVLVILVLAAPGGVLGFVRSWKQRRRATATAPAE